MELHYNEAVKHSASDFIITAFALKIMQYLKKEFREVLGEVRILSMKD